MPRVIPIRALYSAIPATTCPPGCGRCCGPVPIAPQEAVALGLPESTALTPTRPDGLCQFLTDRGCSQYANRPFLCRLFGASRDPGMACSIGCKPVKERLGARDSRRLVVHYLKQTPLERAQAVLLDVLSGHAASRFP